MRIKDPWSLAAEPPVRACPEKSLVAARSRSRWRRGRRPGPRRTAGQPPASQRRRGAAPTTTGTGTRHPSPTRAPRARAPRRRARENRAASAAGMARALLAFAGVATTAALVAPSASIRVSAPLRESFGFDFVEDQAANTPFEILGERRLKTEWVRSYKPTATVIEGKPYRLFQEVQDKKILSATAESGLLGALDDLGLTLSDVEKLLPVVDKSGVLGLAKNNLPLAIVATGYLLIEPAPILIPVLGAALAVPTGVWTGLAAATTAAEVGLVATGDDSLLPLLLAPLLLLSGVLSLVPTAFAAIKDLPEP